MKIKDLLTEATLRTDVPNQSWLEDKINYAKKRGRDRWGAPYFGTVTGRFTDDVTVPVSVLKRLPGMRQEQQNVRHDDLQYLKDLMQRTGKLPLDDRGNEYVPFIMVAYNGEAWVNEGNHRIMAAAELGWPSLPVEIKYFDGGETVESGPLYPHSPVIKH